jgi:hypothetical protein
MKNKNVFIENAKEVFDLLLLTDYSSNFKWNGDELLSLKINTTRNLKITQLSTIIDFCHHHELSVEISRSGAGLKIELTQRYQ